MCLQPLTTTSTTTTSTTTPTTTTASSGKRKRSVSSEAKYKELVKRQAAQVESELDIDKRSYGSVLRYECGLARLFHDPEWDELYEVNNFILNLKILTTFLK